MRPIAIHLPQFHPISENNEWWGKGFTEWTNVAKAKPLFVEHYQPHLPADLGFYDLRLEEARLAQETMAKEYGIYGFCYYHYWFNGKRMLYEPVDRKLKNKKEDLPFMLCWANENWTRRWDGGDETILLEQNYTYEDAVDHALHLMKYFNDERYIKIDNKPVFIIYKSRVIPDNINYISKFRETLKKNGVDIYLIRFETQGHSGIEFLRGYDAAAEFQPFNNWLYSFRLESFKSKFKGYFKKRKLYKLKKSGKLYQLVDEIRHLNYEHYVDYLVSNYKYPEEYTFYPCVTPMWDNTARRGKDGFLFYNSTPEHFFKWLNFHKNKYQPKSKDENFIFLNAWNEWAEGNHLEPCLRWGNKYLKKVKQVFERP